MIFVESIPQHRMKLSLKVKNGANNRLFFFWQSFLIYRNEKFHFNNRKSFL